MPYRIAHIRGTMDPQTHTQTEPNSKGERRRGTTAPQAKTKESARTRGKAAQQGKEWHTLLCPQRPSDRVFSASRAAAAAPSLLLSAMETAVLLRVPLPLAEQLHKQLADKEARTASVAAAAAAAAASGGAAAAAAAAAAAKEKDKDDKGPSIRLHFSGGPTGAVTLMPSGSSSASGGGSGGPLTGQLVNLPSVLEIHKTFNNELFYKVTDVGQVRTPEHKQNYKRCVVASHVRCC
jgi:hypothetical protein